MKEPKVRLSNRYALLICNGEPPVQKLSQHLAKHADLIVAADGGANVARLLGIRPDVVIGDLDSIASATKRFFSSSTFIRLTRQDNTDLEKALDYLIERKCKRVKIIAATGRRIDHTLGNLTVIWNYVSYIDLTFIGEGWCTMPVNVKKGIAAPNGTTVSLIPFGTCTGITLRGLQYPLTNATMNVGEIGVSNVVTKSPFSVEVKEGHMLLIILADYTSIRLLR